MLEPFIDFEMVLNMLTGNRLGHSLSKLFPCVPKTDQCNFWFVTKQFQLPIYKLKTHENQKKGKKYI